MNKQHVFPYMVGNYAELVEDYSYYVDKTPYIAMLERVKNPITGLSLDELQASGGFRLYNPTTGEEVVNPFSPIRAALFTVATKL